MTESWHALGNKTPFCINEEKNTSGYNFHFTRSNRIPVLHQLMTKLSGKLKQKLKHHFHHILWFLMDYLVILTFLLKQTLKMYLLPSNSARFLSTWFTDLCLPSAGCPASMRRRVARSLTCLHCCPSQLPPLLILKSMRNEKPLVGRDLPLMMKMKNFPGAVIRSPCIHALLLPCFNVFLMMHEHFFDTALQSPKDTALSEHSACSIWRICHWNRTLVQNIMQETEWSRKSDLIDGGGALFKNILWEDWLDWHTILMVKQWMVNS